MPAPYLEYESQRAALIKELKDIAPEPLRSELSALIRPTVEIEGVFSSKKSFWFC